MLMSPSPSEETSGPLLPSLRFFTMTASYLVFTVDLTRGATVAPLR
jgi:hypothetical protein